MGFPTVLTRDDLVRAGACHEGVRDKLRRIKDPPTALTVPEALKRFGRDEEALKYIHKAAGMRGSGDGDGDGSGSGDGDGDGYGSGYGSGDGYGYGSGYGEL